eukprot:14727680-Alexandrium_andersonii.AAC.1
MEGPVEGLDQRTGHAALPPLQLPQTEARPVVRRHPEHHVHVQRAAALKLDTDQVAQVAPPLAGVDELPTQHTNEDVVQAQGQRTRRQRRPLR